MAGKKESKEKRYWWLKLPEDFFRSKEIRYLKLKSNGYRLVYIYLSMMLTSLKSGGTLSFDGMGDTPEEEIAVMLDEDVSLVADVVEFLKKHGLLIETAKRDGYFIPFVEDHTGSEGATAQRMRELRARNDVTQNTSQCDDKNITSLRRVRDRVDIELDKDVEYSAAAAESQTPTVHTPPTFSEVEEFCRGKAVDSAKFFNHYESTGWRVKDGRHIRNWKALVENWEKTERPKADPEPQHTPSYGSAAQYDDMDPDWLQAAEAQKGDSDTG